MGNSTRNMPPVSEQEKEASTAQDEQNEQVQDDLTNEERRPSARTRSATVRDPQTQ